MERLLFTPTLEDNIDNGDCVSAVDIWQNWGTYDTQEEAMAVFPAILEDLWHYPVPENHYHAFTIWVDDAETRTASDVIEVIDNIEEGD